MTEEEPDMTDHTSSDMTFREKAALAAACVAVVAGGLTAWSNITTGIKEDGVKESQVIKNQGAIDDLRATINKTSKDLTERIDVLSADAATQRAEIAKSVIENQKILARIVPLAEKGASFADTWPTDGKTVATSENSIKFLYLEKTLNEFKSQTDARFDRIEGRIRYSIPTAAGGWEAITVNPR